MGSQMRDAAGPFANVQTVIGDGGNASAIVATVLETAQSFDQERLGFPISDVPHNPTHATGPRWNNVQVVQALPWKCTL
jgi:hypothetical protein